MRTESRELMINGEAVSAGDKVKVRLAAYSSPRVRKVIEVDPLFEMVSYKTKEGIAWIKASSITELHKA